MQIVGRHVPAPRVVNRQCVGILRALTYTIKACRFRTRILTRWKRIVPGIAPRSSACTFRSDRSIAMQRLAENPELAVRLGRAARDRLCAEFSMRMAPDRLSQVLTAAISTRAPASAEVSERFY